MKALVKTEPVLLFGVDISKFTVKQQRFLMERRYANSDWDCIMRLGYANNSLARWKADPEFVEALKVVMKESLQADATAAESPVVLLAREKVENIVAGVAPEAAEELAKIIRLDWGGCSDREKVSKLKAIETSLRIIGAEKKSVDTGKINVVALIKEIHEGKKAKVINVEAKEVVDA